MTTFSVILPSYQHAAFVERAVRSVLTQSVASVELIAVDDGSTDGSGEILERLAGEDARMRAVRHASNQGIARTLNDGLALARGRYVDFLMSDDVWVEGKLSAELQWHRRFPDSAIWSDGEVVDSQGRPSGMRANQVLHAENRAVDGELFFALLAGNFVNLTSLSVPRDAVGDLRFDESLRFLNDYLFVLELAARLPFRCFPIPLYHWRIHGSNSTSSRNAEGWRNDARLLRELAEARFGSRLGEQGRSALEGFLGGFEGDWGGVPSGSAARTP